MRIAPQIVLTDEQRAKLAVYARGRSVAQRVVERARIILQAAEGKQDREIAATLQMGRAYCGALAGALFEKRLSGDREGCSAAGQNAQD